MSHALHLIASFKVAADQEAMAAEALKLCTQLSRKEAGCISYLPHQNSDDTAQFYVVETWASQAALDEHMQTPHFQALVATLEPLLVEPLAIVAKLQPLL